MRPRGAEVVTVRVRLDSASFAYSSLETSCMDHNRARSAQKTPPIKTPKPMSRDENVVSADSSRPPEALGEPPPMSKV